MATYRSEFVVDLARPPVALHGSHVFAMGDNNAYMITALLCDSRDPAAGLMAGTVSGSLLRPDGVTVVLDGEKGDEVQVVNLAGGGQCNATPCSVTLPQACFAYPGRVTIAVKLTSGDTITTALHLTAMVARTSTDAAVDPGDLIPDIAAIQAAAAEALDAAGDAESAAASATTAASKAVRYDAAQTLSDAQKKTARLNIDAEIESATRLVLSTPGYVQAGSTATTVEVDANGDPVNAASTSTVAVHEVLSISPGDRFCALTPNSGYSSNTRMWMILGAVNTATTPHTRPILAKAESVSELTMYTAPTGAELIVFYTNKTRQNSGTDVYYMGAQTAARADVMEEEIASKASATESVALSGTGYGAELLANTTWTDGYYVNASGVVSPSAASRMSDYIAVSPGMSAFMITEHSPLNTQLITSSISAYTSAKVFIERLGTTSHREGTASVRVTIPDNAAYVIVSTGIPTYLTRTAFYTMAVASGSTIRYDTAQSLTDEQKVQACANAGAALADSVDGLEGLAYKGAGFGDDLLPGTTWTAGYYVNASGVVTSSATSRMSDYIAVNGCTTGFMITVHVPGNNTLMTSSIACYDLNKTFIARAGSTSHREGTATTRVALPARTAYVIISTGISTYLSRTSFYLAKRDAWWGARKWFAIGDSITYGTYSQSGGSIARDTGIAHPVVAATLLGYELTNYGVPGMGFVQVSSVAPGTDTSLPEVLSNHAYTGAELVTVMLGTNDYGHDATLGTIADSSSVASVYGRIKLIVETMQTKCPSARLIFMTPIPRATAGSASTQYCKHYANTAGYTLDDVKTAIITSCEYYGIEYLNLQDTSPLNLANKGTYLLDNLHPSIEGHQRLGEWLASKITF